MIHIKALKKDKKKITLIKWRFSVNINTIYLYLDEVSFIFECHLNRNFFFNENCLIYPKKILVGSAIREGWV